MSANDESIDKIEKPVFGNRRTSLRELAQVVNVSSESVHNIMTVISGVKRVAARPVPKQLNFLRKDRRKQVVGDTISRASVADPTFMKRMAVSDEVHEYDMQTSVKQSSEWRLQNELKPREKKIRSAHEKCTDDWNSGIALDGAYF